MTSKKNVTSSEMEYYVNASSWPPGLEEAREFSKLAIAEWQWPEKRPMFLEKINKARTVTELQQIVIYPLLSGEGMGVIK